MIPLRTSLILAGIAWLLGAATTSATAAAPVQKPNVVVILIDDLNDWTGTLGGHPQVSTPNLDALAERGFEFRNAHAQAGLCHPSRTSLMTSLLPSTTGLYVNTEHIRDPELAKRTFMPKHFENHGYSTHRVGKILHASNQNDYFQHNGPHPGFGPILRGTKKNYLPFFPQPAWDWGVPPFDESEMGDTQVADWTIEYLRKLPQNEPFFFSIGFYRPHVPMYAPQRFFDLYPIDQMEMPATLAGDRDDLPSAAVRFVTRIKNPKHHLFTMNARARTAVQAYLASVSYVDEQLGRVLDALAAAPFADNTIVVVLSDHGFHLGEKEHWAKRTYWERTTHVPMIVLAPGQLAGTSPEAVGLVDLLPTLTELAGIPGLAGIDGAPVAQLDRASGFEPEGRGFESLPACHSNHIVPRTSR